MKQLKVQEQRSAKTRSTEIMILNLPLVMICGFALAWVTIGCIMTLAFVIIGCIKILWHLDKYMSSKENVNQWIQEEETEVADPNNWLE